MDIVGRSGNGVTGILGIVGRSGNGVTGILSMEVIELCGTDFAGRCRSGDMGDEDSLDLI
jgi:hypothetical protein